MGRLVTFCIVLLFASVSFCQAAVFLSHDFDAGSFSSPIINTDSGYISPRNVSPGNAVTVVETDLAHSGNYAVQCQWRAGGDEAGGAELGFGWATVKSDIFIRFYAYFPDGTEPGEQKYEHLDGVSSDNNKFVRIWNNDYEYGKWGATLNQTGADESYLTARGNEDDGCGDNVSINDLYSVYSLSDTNKGEWICFEFYYKPDSGSSDGAWKIWVNGTYLDGREDIATVDGPCSPTGFLTGYIMGYSNSSFDAITNVYIDDVAFSDAYIGPIQQASSSSGGSTGSMY